MTTRREAALDASDPAYKGQKDYGPLFLAVYDWWVLGFMARAVWRSPTPAIIERYRPLFGQRHLDVGPGSGYAIDVAAPDGMELTLLDPNRDVLGHCAKRLSRFDPIVVEADVLKTLPVRGPFDSAALSFVLHCLPAPMKNKASAIRNVAAVLKPDGVLFGGTVLGLEEDHSAPARAFIKAFNKRGAFDNLTDTQNGLDSILSESFSNVAIDVVGSLAFFEARNPIHK